MKMMTEQQIRGWYLFLGYGEKLVVKKECAKFCGVSIFSADSWFTRKKMSPRVQLNLSRFIQQFKK